MTADTQSFITVFGTIISACAAVGALAVAYYASTKRVPTLDAEFATKQEVRNAEQKMEDRMGRMETHMHEQFTHMDDKLDERLNDLDAKRSRQVATLHDAIRGVDNNVTRLRAEIETERRLKGES